MKGHFPLCSPLKSLTSFPCANCVSRACLGYKYANYTSKTEDFRTSSKWKPESRILNNALAVSCLLNQRTQIAQIVFMNQKSELGSYCFSSNSDVGLVENAAENIQGNKQFAKFRMLQIEEGKHVYHIYPLVTLKFRTEVILPCRWRIQW